MKYTHNTRHAIALASASVSGVALGAILVWAFGYGFQPEPPHAVGRDTSNGDTVGIMQLIRMPDGAKSLTDIKTFTLKEVGYDDFGDVFVNNYLVNSSENRHRILYFITDKDKNKDAIDFQSEFARVRNNEIPTPHDVRVFLRRGWNHIVYSLENNKGACDGGIVLEINGIPHETFPQRAIEDFIPDRSLSNANVTTQLRMLGKDRNENILCSRRIWQFYLE